MEERGVEGGLQLEQVDLVVAAVALDQVGPARELRLAGGVCGLGGEEGGEGVAGGEGECFC